MTTRSRFLLLCTAAATIACGDGRVSSGGSFSSTGLDAVLLRVPRSGGIARAHRVGSDSVLFSARDRAPALDGILDFDDFLGVVLLRDANSRILNLDLRLGTVTIPGEERLRGTVVAEGAAAYGLDAQGRIIRVTPSVTWTWPVPGGATSLVPTPDGSLIVLRTDGDGTEWRRVIPPETRVLDSARTAPVRLVERTQAGDRVWAVTNGTLISLRTRDLGQAFEMSLRDSVVALALTPSGDRVFLATDQRRLRVVDRYAESERSAIDLPAPVSALRMDPDGHYLLAKAAKSDSVFVISIGTSRVVSTIASAWRDDLPFVTPAGRILVARDRDVVLVDAESSRDRQRYAGGAADQWTLVRWNGFRPRAVGLDRPVEFEEYAQDSARADSALAAMIRGRYGDITDIARAAPLPAQSAPTPAQPQRPAAAGATGRGTWNVSFATLLTAERAQALADSIIVDGRRARVVPGQRDGVPVWRVLLGPFDTRQAAERAGMASRLSYWVFEGAP
ncbi:MAG: SPOR domain-containing protein [Gemmatimonadaceae bacterium]|nr:SPOR domain-containing protein [Gemmatimonadaceae bacterium]MCW5827353.1 SPOR domain-containing protein [Gemmatimonadaceae bacterium]